MSRTQKERPPKPYSKEKTSQRRQSLRKARRAAKRAMDGGDYFSADLAYSPKTEGWESY